MKQMESYKMFYEDWDAETNDLSLEEEGALLRLCHLMYRVHGPITNLPKVLCGTLRQPPKKTKKLIESLISRGKLTVTADNKITSNMLFPYAEDRYPLPPQLRKLIIERDGLICRYCGTADSKFEIDHIHPVSMGGSDNPENLCVACRPCNRSKGAKLVTEWVQ